MHRYIYVRLCISCVIHNAKDEGHTYSDRGISFELAGSTKTSEVRAMLEHALWTSCNARSDHSLVMAVSTPGRT